MARNHYLNNKKLLECIVEYTARRRVLEAEGKPKPPMPDYAGRCILLICERIGSRGNFRSYTYRDEMVGDAVMDCVNAFYNFDSDRFNNPFGYFSRVAWRAMIRKIFTEKRETYNKHKSYQISAINDTQYEVPEGYQDPRAHRVGSSTEIQISGQEGSNTVIREFEDLLDRRRKSRAEKEDSSSPKLAKTTSKGNDR